jgi:hypothetical protein
MDKAEIEKIEKEYIYYENDNMCQADCDKERQRLVDQATSSLTSLIIKWLEGKKIDILDHHEKYHKDCPRCIEIFTTNQLITELVEEMK